MLLEEPLKNNSTMKCLNLDSNFLRTDDLVAIVRGVGENKNIEEFRCNNQQGIQINRAVFEAVFEAVKSNTTVVKLGLSLDDPNFRNNIDKQIMKNNDAARARRRALSETQG